MSIIVVFVLLSNRVNDVFEHWKVLVKLSCFSKVALVAKLLNYLNTLKKLKNLQNNTKNLTHLDQPLISDSYGSNGYCTPTKPMILRVYFIHFVRYVLSFQSPQC